eukprot:Blabericola_migrator_1__734@NODE_1183_length_5191_cov_163_280445_g805_i0_p2_GENE_NODE_1183_length_5191_cov_163_280445_g805_i0NODE_1183_length_5191_cov_163_280445_g805_i0_p2_ORF_typecomplete_len408_score77_14Flavokinase/PF01687_17/1_3e26_NODE_1183_length_5191_cov_163_280445_g805_i012642487
MATFQGPRIVTPSIPKFWNWRKIFKMQAVDFDHLVADIESLYSGAFKVNSPKACPNSDSSHASVFEVFASHFAGRKFVEHYANLIECVKGVSHSVESHSVESHSALEALVAQVEAHARRYVHTCKPRPGALERLSHTVDTHPTLLITGDIELAKLIWDDWISMSEELKEIFENKIQFLDVQNLRRPNGTKVCVCVSPGIEKRISDLGFDTHTVTRFVLEETPKIFRISSMASLMGAYLLTKKAWAHMEPIPPQIVSGKVVRGLQRGSTALGAPTANVDCKILFQHPVSSNSGTDACACFPVPGTYVGRCVVETDTPCVYGCVTSIGWSPHFGNLVPTVEAHIYHEFNKTFYGANIIVESTHLLRGDCKYSEFAELVAAIQLDCERGWEWYQSASGPLPIEMSRVLKP